MNSIVNSLFIRLYLDEDVNVLVAECAIFSHPPETPRNRVSFSQKTDNCGYPQQKPGFSTPASNPQKPGFFFAENR